MLSPVPKKGTAKLLTFGEAMKAIVDGERVTKLEWNSNDNYGFLQGDILHIQIGKESSKWIVSYGDLTGEDYAVLPKA